MRLRLKKMARITFLFALTIGTALKADEIHYRYDADVLPYDPSGGWQIYSPCMGTCAESLEQGHFVLTWSASGGRFANYDRRLADPATTFPPPPFWVEWRFASNNAIHGFSGGDGTFVIYYNTALGEIQMYGDAIVSSDGGSAATGLELNQFRTFRFESPDANQWCIWYDGKLFDCGVNGTSPGLANHLQLQGHGESPTQTVNRWDYVRYGRVTTGETIIASDPPTGYLDPAIYSNLDRFTVTFDQPNYVYIDDIFVDVEGSVATRQQSREGATAGTAPMVTATRRQDNGPPETVEIVLDRPLAAGSTYRFTFNTGAATPQTIEYIMTRDPHPVIPTTTTWGIVALSLLLAIAAKLLYSGLPSLQ